MSEWLLPAVVLAAVSTSTYLFCLRPMRRRSCRLASVAAPPEDLDQQLEQARRELRRLRARPQLGPARGADGAARRRPGVSASSLARADAVDPWAGP